MDFLTSKLGLDDLLKDLSIPIPKQLPPDTTVFDIPARLEKILDRDLKAAGRDVIGLGAGVYPALSNNDPRMVGVGLFGVVRDGREAAEDMLRGFDSATADVAAE